MLDLVCRFFSACGFRQASAKVAKFSRSFNEATLSPRAFCVGHGLVAEAIDFSACHLGCFAPASFLTRNSAASKAALHEQSDRDRPRRKIALFTAPLI
ncbi:MAG: hypothetical protein WAM72_19580 [Xanthobacteraceae bacterium]